MTFYLFCTLYCNLIFAQPTLLNDTIKYYNFSGSLESVVIRESDSSITTIAYRFGKKTYHGNLKIIGNDTITNYKSYHCNEIVWENGQLIGNSRKLVSKQSFSPDGKPLYLGNYNQKTGNGIQYEYFYHECNLIEYTISIYKNHLLNGNQIKLSKINGDTISIVSYKMGIRNGVHKMYTNGKLARESNYRNDTLFGKISYYDKSSKLVNVQNIEEGTITEIKPQVNSINIKFEENTISICKKLIKLNQYNNNIELDSLISEFFVLNQKNSISARERLTELANSLRYNTFYEIRNYVLANNPISINYTWNYCAENNLNLNHYINPSSIVIVQFSENDYLKNFYFYFREDSKIKSLRPLFVFNVIKKKTEIVCFEEFL